MGNLPGSQAIHFAVLAGDRDELRRLLHADPRLANADGAVTPLLMATFVSSLEMARCLLDEGAIVDRAVSLGVTPLMVACQRGDARLATLLLDRGADPTLLAHNGANGLMTAVMYNHPEVVRVLVRDGRTVVEQVGPQGQTAFALACSQGCTQCARVLLLEGGADPCHVDRQGRSPKELAKAKHHNPCVRLIEWWEGERTRLWLLRKARALCDHHHVITQAALHTLPHTRTTHTGVRLTRGAVRDAVSQATPPHLRPRLVARLPLPTLSVATSEELCMARAAKGRRKGGGGKRLRESSEHKNRTEVLVGVAMHVVTALKEDLLTDLLAYMQLPTRRLGD